MTRAMQKLSFLAVTAVVGCASVGAAAAQTSPSNPAKLTASNVEHRLALSSATATPSDATKGINAAAMAPARAESPVAATAPTLGGSITSAMPVHGTEGISAARTEPAPAFASPSPAASLPSAERTGISERSVVAAALPSQALPSSSISAAGMPSAAIPQAAPSPTRKALSTTTAIRSAALRDATVRKTPKAKPVSKGSRARAK